MGGVECVEIKINKSLCVIDSIRNMLFFSFLCYVPYEWMNEMYSVLSLLLLFAGPCHVWCMYVRS